MNQIIAIVGTGRVASAMAQGLAASSIPINAIAGRDPVRTASLARKISAPHAVAIPEASRFASHILVAVSDDAIHSVLDQLVAAQVVLHTSGALGPLLTASDTATGVLHPLQTFPQGDFHASLFTEVFFGYGGDPAAEEWALQLIAALGGKPLHVAAGKWAYYHAAAVVASNYQAALLDTAAELMAEAGLPENQALSALAPLARASLENALRLGPTAALTGPIQRGDAKTVQRHLQALATQSTSAKRLYAAAGLRALEIAARLGSTPQQLRTTLEAGYHDGSASD